MKMKLGVIGAMEIEIETLLSFMKECGDVKERDVLSLKFYEGNIYEVPVVVVKSGIGKVNAALCAQCLMLKFGVTHVLNTGIAGAMQSGLKVFDIVVSTESLYHDVDVSAFGYDVGVIPQMKESVFKADNFLIKAAETAFEKIEKQAERTLVKGRVASGDQFVSSRELKNKIMTLFHPACVEMEGAAVAHACYLSGVPFVIIRCMSDMADDGEECAYKFNDKIAAKESARLVIEMCKSFCE